MVLGNVERLEVVVRSFHLRPGNHRVAERKKNPFDLLERLPQRMARAERANHARKGEIFALARERRLIGRGLDFRAPQFERRFDVRLQFVEGLSDRPLQFGLCRLEPGFGDLREHAGFAAEPIVAEGFPGVFVEGTRGILLKSQPQFRKANAHLIGGRSVERGKRLSCRNSIGIHCAAKAPGSAGILLVPGLERPGF